MDIAKSVMACILFVVIIVARFTFVPKEVDPKVQEAALQQKAAEDRATHLNAKCGYLLQSRQNDYAVMFPEKPRQPQFVFIGENDDDYELIWKYDTTFKIVRSEWDNSRRRDPAKDRQSLKDYQESVIKHHNIDGNDKPTSWVLAGEREFVIDGQWQAREFRYTYKKYTTELPRTGRAWVIKIPGAIIRLHVDGETDVIDSPLAESFFQSFACVPNS